MQPVLPAFAGGVPDEMEDLFPRANFSRNGNWGNFGKYAHVLLLSPTDSLFENIGKSFMRNLLEVYGANSRSHYYSADTFNENRPEVTGPALSEYLQASSSSVYKAMASVDANAVWVMQGWLFAHDKQFWDQGNIESLLSGVPRGRLILLDLFSDVVSVHGRKDIDWSKGELSYVPWIWNMLHSFGGSTGL